METSKTMVLSEKIDTLKQFIRSKGFLDFTKKFTDIRIDKNLIYLECKLTNNHIINFIIPTDSSDIYINMYGSNKLPLVYEEKIRHKFIKIVKECLTVAHIANKGDLHLFLFKFYVDAVKYLGSKFNGYDVPYIDELAIKADVHGLISKLYGYGKKSDYEEMMKKYHDVLM